MHETLTDRIGRYLIYMILIMMVFIMVVPFMYIFSTAISNEAAVAKYGMLLLPVHGLSLDTVLIMIQPESGIIRAYGNTIFITVTGTLLSLFVTSMLGYAVSKRNLAGRKIYIASLIFTMMFNGGLIPTYFVIKGLGMINSYTSMIIPGLISTYYVILLMRYFESIPASLEESAKIDGGNDIRIYFNIYVPVSLPILLSIAVFLVDGYWNQWFGPMIYVNDSKKWPIQVILRQLMRSSNFQDLVSGQRIESIVSKPNQLLQSAVIVITVVPLMIVFPFVQKYFIKGVMLGAVKE